MAARFFQFILAFSLFLPIFASAQSPEGFVDPSVSLPDEGAVATSTDVRAEIVEIIDDAFVEGVRTIEFYADDAAGERYRVSTDASHTEGMQYGLNVGDDVLLSVIRDGMGNRTAYLSDVVRTSALVWIALIFAVITIAVGLRRGALALVGFAVTIGILFWFVFPRILGGSDPVLTTALASIVILAVNLFLSHGVTRNTGVAFVSTALGVLLAWLFSATFVALANLSGLSSEEATFLYWQFGGLSSPTGLLLAGIILGAVGVLDDVAITQCETVAELKAANPRLTRRELFVRAMRVGRHHIASTVNTLVLAYAGSALPLFLIFLADDSVSLMRFLNTEAVAEEIVRTLAGTTALVLTVPLATLLASVAWAYARAEDRQAFHHDEHGA